MTAQLYKYRVFIAGHVPGTYMLVGDAEGRDGENAIDEAIKVYQPEHTGLLSGVEFLAVPVSRVTATWRRLEQQTVLVPLDGPPAPVDVQTPTAAAEEILGEAQTVTLAEASLPVMDDARPEPDPDGA